MVLSLEFLANCVLRPAVNKWGLCSYLWHIWSKWKAGGKEDCADWLHSLSAIIRNNNRFEWPDVRNLSQQSTAALSTICFCTKIPHFKLWEYLEKSHTQGQKQLWEAIISLWVDLKINSVIRISYVFSAFFNSVCTEEWHHQAIYQASINPCWKLAGAESLQNFTPAHKMTNCETNVTVGHDRRKRRNLWRNCPFC